MLCSVSTAMGKEEGSSWKRKAALCPEGLTALLPGQQYHCLIVNRRGISINFKKYHIQIHLLFRISIQVEVMRT